MRRLSPPWDLTPEHAERPEFSRSAENDLTKSCPDESDLFPERRFVCSCPPTLKLALGVSRQSERPAPGASLQNELSKTMVFIGENRPRFLDQGLPWFKLLDPLHRPVAQHNVPQTCAKHSTRSQSFQLRRSVRVRPRLKHNAPEFVKRAVENIGLY